MVNGQLSVQSIIWGKILQLVIIISAILLPSISSAKLASFDEMNNVCQNWLILNQFQNLEWTESTPQIDFFEDIFVNEMLLGRLYTIKPNGFVVVPVLKGLPPIIAYADDCKIDSYQEQGIKDLIRELLYNRAQMYISVFGDLNAEVPSNNRDLSRDSHQTLWDRLSKNGEEFVADLKSNGVHRSESVGPIIETAWHQGYPYNMYCPPGHEENTTAVGCVATATSQIMNFWQWPKFGHGSASFDWGGDQSCDSNTTGMTLTADFSDEYIYDGLPENMAELCYEVGVALYMDYGVCGSATDGAVVSAILPGYFKYNDSIDRDPRYNHESPTDWYNSIKEEIDANHPLYYGITSHAIVCDGYRDTEGLLQYHMNYGWGGFMNAWFSIDTLYCTWGCSAFDEFVYRHVVPQWSEITSDIDLGPAPQEINFTGITDLIPTSNTMKFGDGQTANGTELTWTHNYTTPGLYDVTLDIIIGDEIYSVTEPDFVAITADTLIAGHVEGEPGDKIEIPVYARNCIPIEKITMPIRYSGSLTLKYDSASTVGCRTEELQFEENSFGAGLLIYEFQSDGADLQPGDGNILKLYFTVYSGTDEDVALISFNNIGSTYATFEGLDGKYVYNPVLVAGNVTAPSIVGDADGDRAINILDVVYIINLIYKKGPEAVPPHVANVNGDELINILDVVYLINFIYKDGPDPVVM